MLLMFIITCVVIFFSLRILVINWRGEMCIRRERIEIQNTQYLSQDIHREEIEILEFISTTHRKEFHKRRDTEWGMIIPVLTVYAAVSYAKLKHQLWFSQNQCCLKITISIAFFLLAIILILYLIDLHEANRKNKYMAIKAENQLAKFLKNNEFSSEFYNGGNWSLRWQIVTVLIFLLVSTIIVIL